MTNTNKPDLRDGKPHIAPTTEAQLPGHDDKIMPVPPSGHQVKLTREPAKSVLSGGTGMAICFPSREAFCLPVFLAGHVIRFLARI
jgi:hypothetical protein